MAINGSKANLDLKPVVLIAGLIGVPIASGAIGRTFITPKENIKTEEESLAELRRLFRNFGVYYGLTAAGLGYISSRKDLSQGWRNAAAGGAIGTGLLAAFIGVTLVMAPSKVTPPDDQKPPPGGVRGGGLFGPSTGNHAAAPAWASSFVNLPR